MTGSFGKADIAGNDGLEYVALEEFPQIGGNLASEIRPVIEHRQENTFDLKRMPEGVPDPVNRIHQLRDALESEEFALNWDQNGVGCHH